jgi:hypothetical protein
VLLALKAAGLALDSTIRFYLGDSAAYLYGAMDNGRLPDDRSFTYSFLLRGLVRPFEALSALLIWQTLAGVAVAVLAWHVLVRRLDVPARVALGAACLIAIEPAQLYYERMVLAEAFGILAFMLFFAAASAYVASGRAVWLPAVAALGLAAASLRLNYLPVVLVISLIVPLLSAVGQSRRGASKTGGHLLLAAACVATMHLGYQQWVGAIFGTPPAYLGRAGFMQLGLVMPLVTPEQLARVGVPDDLAPSLVYPIEDPQARMRHQWSPGGFVHALRERSIAVEPVARPLAAMALRENPLGLVRLGLPTTAQYFTADGIAHALNNDLGHRVIPDEILASLRAVWRHDATGVWARETPVSRYFRHGTWWLVATLFLLAPLAIAVAVRSRPSPRRAQAWLLALVSLGLVAAHVLFVPVALYRYMHPLPVFVLMAAACVFGTRRVRT